MIQRPRLSNDYVSLNIYHEHEPAKQQTKLGRTEGPAEDLCSDILHEGMDQNRRSGYEPKDLVRPTSLVTLDFPYPEHLWLCIALSSGITLNLLTCKAEQY